MVKEWFVKIDYVPVISNSVEVNVNNDGIVIGEEMQAENLCNGSTTKSTDVISATATNGESGASWQEGKFAILNLDKLCERVCLQHQHFTEIRI
ncbi:hypothetical protein OUZ56_010726 [Daphnia magna]|uniref:Uncharacterized protein n=1 Tax=Daphnia magna TaxID=35525 RepID=A0ABQ9YYF2_9CRUS|nr:hypothetical protein OUZ56_010726 [Daphnia magna]